MFKSFKLCTLSVVILLYAIYTSIKSQAIIFKLKKEKQDQNKRERKCNGEKKLEHKLREGGVVRLPTRDDENLNEVG